MESKEKFVPPKISININRKSFDAFMLAAEELLKTAEENKSFRIVLESNPEADKVKIKVYPKYVLKEQPMDNKIIERLERIADKYAELTERRLETALEAELLDGTVMAEINDGIRMIAYAVTTIQRIKSISAPFPTLTNQMEQSSHMR